MELKISLKGDPFQIKKLKDNIKDYIKKKIVLENLNVELEFRIK